MGVREIATDLNWCSHCVFVCLCRRVFWNIFKLDLSMDEHSVCNQCEMFLFCCFFFHWFAVDLFCLLNRQYVARAIFVWQRRSVRSYLIWSVETANRFLSKLVISFTAAIGAAAVDWIQLCVLLYLHWRSLNRFNLASERVHAICLWMELFKQLNRNNFSTAVTKCSVFGRQKMRRKLIEIFFLCFGR